MCGDMMFYTENSQIIFIVTAADCPFNDVMDHDWFLRFSTDATLPAVFK
jgi:hypothetical protein